MIAQIADVCRAFGHPGCYLRCRKRRVGIVRWQINILSFKHNPNATALRHTFIKRNQNQKNKNNFQGFHNTIVWLIMSAHVHDHYISTCRLAANVLSIHHEKNFNPLNSKILHVNAFLLTYEQVLCAYKQAAKKCIEVKMSVRHSCLYY